jgi:ATP-dependent Lhr-like helicase
MAVDSGESATNYHRMTSARNRSVVLDWFAAKYGRPTPAQRAAWPRIRRGENVLIASPTGTGKTFAAFLSVLDGLARLHAAGKLTDSIQCLYVSPLRALGYDLEKNLNKPLREIFGEQSPIRVELRSGDTSQHQRARQFTKPPHILLTTPESLCVLLSQEKWLPRLVTVRWLIVDEIHALADNKRGVHLALSIERLAQSRLGFQPSAGKRSAVAALRRSGLEVHPALQRIGLSATVSPLAEVAQFLAGTHGRCAVVDASARKRIELRIHTPLRKNPYPAAGYTGQRLVRELGSLIRKHQTTLVFCNTRSGAEGTTFWLRESLPDLADRIECHHASLERDVRREVEDRLKRGELRAVVCSTSLELGIDIGSVELVVMMSTPKGVSKALQRAGRAGHNIHAVSRGVLMATNVSDLVESCATVLLARRRHLDDVRIPHAPLDVLAQHLVSMGCTQRWTRAEALALVRCAYPFRDLPEQDFHDVLDYLAGGGASLRQRYSEVFGKIELDDDGFQTRPGRVQRDFLQNVGTIPSVGQVRVRAGHRVLGSVEEFFMRQISIGDVFVLAGRPVRLDKVTQMDAWVTPAPGARPTVPRWNASKFPLSNRVCQEIVAFRSELRDRTTGDSPVPSAKITGGPPVVQWIARRLDCGKANAEIIARIHAAQAELSEIPTGDFLLVEEYSETDEMEQAPRSLHYFFHSLIGRAANDALARVITARLSKLRGGNAVATPHDYGFVLTVEKRQRFTEEELRSLLRPERFEAELDEALAQSEMLKYHFRNAAQTGLMVYRNFFDQQKPMRKLAWSAEVIFNVLRQHEPAHVLLREARRDTLQAFLDADGALAFLDAQRSRPVRLRQVSTVPPLSFAMYATKIKEALLVEDPFEVQERLFNHWWSQIEGIADHGLQIAD